jgi:hypothetical protein
MPISSRSTRESKSEELNLSVEVRELRGSLPGDALPLRRLGKLVGTSAASLCMWELGTRTLAPSRQREVLRIVRAEFARHVDKVVALAARHGVLSDGREKLRNASSGKRPGSFPI